MRLIAYDFEALLRMAQQAPWTDGLQEARLWSGDVRRAARPETGFGHDAGAGARVFDAALVDEVMARLGHAHEELGGLKPLRDLLADDPGRSVLPGVDGWALYEDLVRLWTSLVTTTFAPGDLCDEGGLLDQLGKGTGHDLRLGRECPLTRGIGMPYPARWQKEPRARIYHASGEALDALAGIGRPEVERTAAALDRPPAEIATTIGTLLRHFELARQFDTVVAIDPSDAFWT